MACEYPCNVTGIAPNAGVPGFVDGSDCDMPCDSTKPNITDITCWNESGLNGACSRDNWYSQLPFEYECSMDESLTRAVPILAFFGYEDEHTIFGSGAGHNFLSTTRNNGRPTPPVTFIAKWASKLAQCDERLSIDELSFILEDLRLDEKIMMK